jgi:hypothetical protein
MELPKRKREMAWLRKCPSIAADTGTVDGELVGDDKRDEKDTCATKVWNASLRDDGDIYWLLTVTGKRLHARSKGWVPDKIKDRARI